MHGKGVYHFSHGLVYEGEFYRGDKHGNGKIITEHGIVYEGIWEENRCTELLCWESFPILKQSPNISEPRLEPSKQCQTDSTYKAPSVKAL